MSLFRKILITSSLLATMFGASAATLPLCSVSTATWEDLPGTSEKTDGQLSVFGWYTGAAPYSFSLQTKIDSETKWTDASIAQGHDIDGNKSRWGLSRPTSNLVAGNHSVQVRVVSLGSTVEARSCGTALFKVTPPVTGECISALNSAHVTAARAFSMLTYAYAKGTNDALGLITASSSLEKISEGNWRKVASCQ